MTMLNADVINVVAAFVDNETLRALVSTCKRLAQSYRLGWMRPRLLPNGKRHGRWKTEERDHVTYFNGDVTYKRTWRISSNMVGCYTTTRDGKFHGISAVWDSKTRLMFRWVYNEGNLTTIYEYSHNGRIHSIRIPNGIHIRIQPRRKRSTRLLDVGQ